MPYGSDSISQASVALFLNFTQNVTLICLSKFRLPNITLKARTGTSDFCQIWHSCHYGGETADFRYYQVQFTATGCYTKSFRKIYSHIYNTATLRRSTNVNRHCSDTVTTFFNRWTSRTKISVLSRHYRIRSHGDSDVCLCHWYHHKKRGSLYNTVKPSGHYMYHQFNIQQFYVLPTQCIYVFCVDLRTNSDYFPIRH